MPLETTIICLDFSEWMRNGDYTPTRLEAQKDAINIICDAKTQSHQESTVGLIKMAEKRVQLLTSPTRDMGKILAVIHGLEFERQSNFLCGIQTAQLALKHRKNKNGGQRIILFVGSPIEEEEAKLLKAAKDLKKNNIAVDIIMMGENDKNLDKLQKFVDTVNSSENNSHLLVIPPGVFVTDVLLASPVVSEMPGGAGVGGAGAGAGLYQEFGGIDPNLDPELAMALRISMEEERVRQEAAAKSMASNQTTSEQRMEQSRPSERQTSQTENALTEGHTQEARQNESADVMNDEFDDENELLQQALAMSLFEGSNSTPTTTKVEETTATEVSDTKPQESSQVESSQAFLDPQFVQSMLSEFEGVDVNDPAIQAVLQQLKNNENAEKKNERKN